MNVYHGTTQRTALKIVRTGFKPRNGAVWFTTSRSYVLGRAQHKARSRRDRPVVLNCDLDLDGIRTRIGGHRVKAGGGIIAIRGSIPATVLKSNLIWEILAFPEELAAWVNQQLGLQSHNGVSPRHRGIERLSGWMQNRLDSGNGRRIHAPEFVQKGKNWLPEFFRKMQIDPENLPVRHWDGMLEVKTETEVKDESAVEKINPREIKAFECLESETSKGRVRGLKLLAQIGSADLFDWCAMFINDESDEVVLAALKTMLQCGEGNSVVILPFVESEDKRIRAAAIAALAKHADEDAPFWFEWGLKNREACVRLETATLLTELNPAKHKDLFEIASHDPNPEVKKLAQKAINGTGG